jgi:hypothetical protein
MTRNKLYWLSSMMALLAVMLLAQSAYAQGGDATPNPTVEATTEPTNTPTTEPTGEPSATPISEPTSEPSATPTDKPTAEPTDEPTAEPITEPTAEPTATPTTEPTAEPTPAGFVVQVTGPEAVTVGDTVMVNVVASDVPEPGMYGYQFQLNWDSAAFAPVEDNLSLSTDFPAVGQSILATGQLNVAASRQGDVPDLPGNITLVSLTLQANTVTDPNASVFSLSQVKIGRRDGLDVPVDQVINLSVVVVGDLSGDIVGNVMVEGYAADNQAGHTILAESLTATTDAGGNFTLNGAPFGVYTLTADSAGFLDAVCQNVNHTGKPTTLANVTLLAGDLNDDDVIDIADAVAIGAVFGSITPGEVADLNVDGLVDVLDLILLAANYGQTSAANPWVCHPGS